MIGNGAARIKEDLFIIRRENLRRIAEDLGGQRFLAERLGKSPSQMSQLIGRRSHDLVKTKGIGSKLAREIEQKMNKERGWLDIQHNDKTSYQIPVVDIDGFDGQPFDSENWPQSNIYITSRTKSMLDNHDNSIILLSCDSGMAPEITPDDILLCRRTSEFSGDGIYVIRLNNHKYVRYVAYDPIISGNNPIYQIKAASSMIQDHQLGEEQVEFIAKIREVWKRQTY